jgi:hypothetical protein
MSKVTKLNVLIEVDDPQSRTNSQACAAIMSSLSKDGFLNPVVLDCEMVEVYDR